jgi:hypothetical protein
MDWSLGYHRTHVPLRAYVHNCAHAHQIGQHFCIVSRNLCSKRSEARPLLRSGFAPLLLPLPIPQCEMNFNPISNDTPNTTHFTNLTLLLGLLDHPLRVQFTPLRYSRFNYAFIISRPPQPQCIQLDEKWNRIRAP